MAIIKSAFVTGGSGGIGSHVCRALAEDGWLVLVGYRKNEAAAKTLAREIGGAAAFADVRDPALIERLCSDNGSPELLVNCAGSALYGMITDNSQEEIAQCLAVNLLGAINCCRAALPAMLSRRRGRIINVSSLWGVEGASCEAVYSAAKAGVIALTKSLAKEYDGSGIVISALAPGAVMTDMLARFSPQELGQIAAESAGGVIASAQKAAQTVLQMTRLAKSGAIYDLELNEI